MVFLVWRGWVFRDPVNQLISVPCQGTENEMVVSLLRYSSAHLLQHDPN